MAPRKRKATDDGGGGGKSVKIRKNTTEPRITRNMTTDGPRQAVFRTAELLENILVHLPAKTIFGCQRVSRQFRDVIATSAAIRYKLFLKISDEEPQLWAAHSDQTPPFSLLAADDVRLVKPSSSESNVDNQQKIVTLARLNPLLRDFKFESFNSAKRAYLLRGGNLTLICDMPLRACSSWRKTYLTNPPTKSAFVHLVVQSARFKSRYGCARYTVATSGSQGLTLGDVVDAVNTKRSWSGKTGGRTGEMGELTIDDVVKKLHATEKNPAYLSASDTRVHLHRVVIPSEDEWKDLDVNAATEP